MTTGDLTITEAGSGTNLATYTITESATQKEIPRAVLNKSDGSEIDPVGESTFDTKIGALTETAPASDTASSGLNGRMQRVAQRVTSLIALLPASLGQKARSASLAVTLSSEDVTALTPPSAITGFATEATLDARLGGLTESAPGSDTGSSGLNGRLQRVAQRLTSLIALMRSPTAGTGTISSVASSASSVTILAANSSRKAFIIYNDSTQILRLNFQGNTASSSVFSTALEANGGVYESGEPVYTGLVTGIWDSANGNARVTELA